MKTVNWAITLTSLAPLCVLLIAHLMFDIAVHNSEMEGIMFYMIAFCVLISLTLKKVPLFLLLVCALAYTFMFSVLVSFTIYAATSGNSMALYRVSAIIFTFVFVFYTFLIHKIAKVSHKGEGKVLFLPVLVRIVCAVSASCIGLYCVMT